MIHQHYTAMISSLSNRSSLSLIFLDTKHFSFVALRTFCVQKGHGLSFYQKNQLMSQFDRKKDLVSELVSLWGVLLAGFSSRNNISYHVAGASEKKDVS